MDFSKLRFNIPKTIYVNFKCFDFLTAIKLPVIVYRKTKFFSLRGKVIITGKIQRGMIRIGYPYVTIFDFRSPTLIEVLGKIEFKGKASIGHGSSVSVGKNGKLIIGDNFNISSSSSIICHNKIEFGTNNLLSWDIIVMDTDFHNYKVNGIVKAWNGEVKVCDNVWIGMRSTILKDSYIPTETVVAANSVVSGDRLKNYNGNILIGGNPAKVIKEGINWPP